MATVRLYDTTLRDGMQAEGFQLSVADKLEIAQRLDDLGVSWIEGGSPGLILRDAAFFERARQLSFNTASLVAFGAVRKAGIRCEDDESVQALLAAHVPAVTVFGKAWCRNAAEILGVDRQENVDLVYDTIAYLKARVDEVIFDADHFFDGVDTDAGYAMEVVEAAVQAGADWVVLCDTNGGALPHTVSKRVKEVVRRFGVSVGVHAHNDAECAVANSLAGVLAGAEMVQCTVNGYGERCGNANLVSVAAALELKMGRPCLHPGALGRLAGLSRLVDDRSGNRPFTRQPYVGKNAFAHSPGVHEHAPMSSPSTNEHIAPELVGNERRLLVSDGKGRYDIVAKALQFGVDVTVDDPRLYAVLARVKRLEAEGWQFEDAEASLELLFEEMMGRRPRWFDVEAAEVTTKVAHGSKASSARLAVRVGDELLECDAVANGPIHALGMALRQALEPRWPQLKGVRLHDYSVRIMPGPDPAVDVGTGARCRVRVEFADGDRRWVTVGVSTNVLEASWRALMEGFEYALLRAGVPGKLDTAAA